MMTILREKMKKIFTENEFRVVLGAGLILIASVAFEGGYLKGKTALNSPIVIEKPIQTQNLSSEVVQGNAFGGQKTTQEAEIDPSGSDTPGKNPAVGGTSCAFVGSKNSNKYHLPTSRCARQIKPENLVCFASVEDAKAKNYQEGCLK